jgi:FkbM family methyltransferase
MTKDYWFNSELKEQKFVRKMVLTGMTVFDVGSNIGKYTKLFSLLVGPKGRVFAFEPTEMSYEITKTAAKDVGNNNVTCIKKAVYSENVTLEFNEFPEEYSSWNSIGRPIMEDPKDHAKYVPIVNSVKVEAITLDSFCDELQIKSIDYLKLDVEGAEIFALIGAKKMLKDKAIKYLQFEISQKMLEGLNTGAKEVFDYLLSLGYESHIITDDGVIGDVVFDSNDFYNNYVAIPVAVSPSVSSYDKEIILKDVKTMFTENNLWTPQTQMLQSIYKFVLNSDILPLNSLSIDNNPELDSILRTKWGSFTPVRAIYPDVDVQDLSQFADESFDVVYSHQVLEHIPKPWIAAREIIRVTRKNGFGIHTTCAFNPRHGQPEFNDFYRFLPDGLAELFEKVTILVKGEWGNRQAILYNVGINDGHGNLGGRRFPQSVGEYNDGLYPWVTWIIYKKD